MLEFFIYKHPVFLNVHIQLFDPFQDYCNTFRLLGTLTDIQKIAEER